MPIGISIFVIVCDSGPKMWAFTTKDAQGVHSCVRHSQSVSDKISVRRQTAPDLAEHSLPHSMNGPSSWFLRCRDFIR